MTVARALLIALGLGAAPAIAAGFEFHRALYHGSKFGIGIDYTLQIRLQEFDELQWMRLPEDGKTATPPVLATQRVHISLSYSVLGAEVETDTLLDPTDGHTLQRIVRRKRPAYVSYKATQFGVGGLRILRLRGGPPDADLDWTKARASHRRYPDWYGADHHASDANALFYLLQREPMHEPGGRLQVPILSNDHLILAELRGEQMLLTECNYLVSADGEERQVEQMREALLVSVGARHLDPEPRDRNLTVLGMQGDVEILVDREHRLPLRISGRVPNVGEVALNLQRLEH